MAQIDSVDKIVGSYFTAITSVPFFYKGVRWSPKLLVVSPTLVRGFTCPAQCAGCCPRFSLDYLPNGEERPAGTKPREVRFDGRKILLMSDTQQDHKNHHCRNVQSDGRCRIHGRQPFSCDFELIRIIHSKEQATMTQRLFGRGWQMLRVDGTRGALCEMTEPTDETISDVIRKLKRLRQWAQHFGLKTRVDSVIDWCIKGPPFERLEIPA